MGRPQVGLLHGLDDPGDIWGDLVPVVAKVRRDGLERSGEPTPRMKQSFEAIAGETGTNQTTIAFEAWWANLGEGLGDGVVPVHSLARTSAPPPTMVAASHRGLLAGTPLSSNVPPAIPIIREILGRWLDP